MNERFNGEGTHTEEGIRAALEGNGPEIVLIAMDGEDAAGFICGQIVKSMCYSTYCGEITEMFVEEGCRRQGVGRQLMEAMEEEFKREGVRSFQLFTGGKNVSAQRFYEGRGYQRADEVMYRKRT
jgi:ribosomal protein S18 acetylase RimI-like enzyme